MKVKLKVSKKPETDKSFEYEEDTTGTVDEIWRKTVSNIMKKAAKVEKKGSDEISK